MSWTIHIDGGSRGNPGPAGSGVEILDASGQAVFCGGFFLGQMTNNQAEYHALLAALQLARAAEAKDLEIYSDSELVVRQINGQYKVKSEDLKPLFEQARSTLAELDRWRITHVPRNRNVEADQLANQAMDAAANIVEVDQLSLAGKVACSRQEKQASANPTSAKSPPPSEPAVVVRVKRAPRTKSACTGKLKKGQEFTFTDRVPAGMCIDGCATVMPLVQAVLEQQQHDPAHDEPITCQCANTRCAAVFEVFLK